MSKLRDHAGDPNGPLREVVEYTADQLPEFERRLKDLNKLARRIELEQARLRAIIAAMKSDGLVSDDDVVSGGRKRLPRPLARQLRAEAGEAIYDYMSGKPKGTEFTYGQLQRQFTRDIAFMFPRILEEWNATHPTRKIAHNEKERAERRYFLG